MKHACCYWRYKLKSSQANQETGVPRCSVNFTFSVAHWMALQVLVLWWVLLKHDTWEGKCFVLCCKTWYALYRKLLYMLWIKSNQILFTSNCSGTTSNQELGTLFAQSCNEYRAMGHRRGSWIAVPCHPPRPPLFSERWHSAGQCGAD